MKLRNYSIQLLYLKFSPLDFSSLKTDERIEFNGRKTCFSLPIEIDYRDMFGNS